MCEPIHTTLSLFNLDTNNTVFDINKADYGRFPFI